MSKLVPIKIIGVNTGNSLDAADIVLTEFMAEDQRDLAFESVPFPAELKENLRKLREAIEAEHGEVLKALDSGALPKNGSLIIAEFTRFVAEAVGAFMQRHGKADAIGFHGQTCAHYPPSVARKTAAEPYTVQVGDGQLLADLTGTAVVYDFRSDDVMLGGEGAPLAPIHHQHLARVTMRHGWFPIAFCNAGNTGNISVLSGTGAALLPSLGWDNGPFNDYPDLLCRLERNAPCDLNGQWGKNGAVNTALLRLLFERSATTDTGENFLLLPPPKSSDPQWYRRLPELMGRAPLGGATISFEDRLRTAEYFAAYIFVYGLSLIPANYPMPAYFALCGGGWKNDVIREHFADLLTAGSGASPILPEHQAVFDEVKRRVGPAPVIKFSGDFGFDGHAMEARIFADAAYSRLAGIPFSAPESTGVSRPALLGIVRYPGKDPKCASPKVTELLQTQQAVTPPPDGIVFDDRWSRAAAGWRRRLAQI